MNSNYKILSLDGGGSWAMLQALALKEIFKKKYPNKEVKGHEVLRHFDLVIANSGGSMVLGGLACNWTFDEIIALFDDETNRRDIFKKLSFREKFFPVNILSLLGIKSVGTKYSSTAKKKTLSNLLALEGKKKIMLKDVLLSELPNIIGKDSLEIIVTTYDIINNRAKLFRSNRYSKARAEVLVNMDEFDEVNMVEAIHGSSNAPVNYFDFPAIFSPEKSKNRFYLWDGALGGFNNPVMLALTEAFANGVKREDINILSIGTGSKVRSVIDANLYRYQYYSTLLGRKLRLGEDGEIDFERMKFIKFFTWKIKRPRFFNRLFRGGAFYSSTISALSQTILSEPHSWANYSAYMSLFSDNINDANNGNRFVRFSPQIILEDDSSDLIKSLYSLDMDVIEQKDMEFIKRCFKAWIGGSITNEAIHWVKTLEGKYVYAIGQPTFNEAVSNLDWL